MSYGKRNLKKKREKTNKTTPKTEDMVSRKSITIITDTRINTNSMFSSDEYWRLTHTYPEQLFTQSEIVL